MITIVITIKMEKKKKYTINDKKNNGHQNPLPHRRKN